MAYDSRTIRIGTIRPEAAYGGKRVTLRADLGSARLRVQVDVGIGDTVTPEPEWIDYPSLLDYPPPRLRAYPPEAFVAEKLHAMVVLGSKNSRMRDFFDVEALAARHTFDGERLVHALRATFERRETLLPDADPLALTTAFAEVDGKRRQWKAFLDRSRIGARADTLDTVVERIASFLAPALAAARADRPFEMTWPAGGPWQPTG
jgi:hypothetical protein